MINRHNRTTRRVLSNTIIIGLRAVKPRRKCLYAFIRSQVYALIAEIVELIEIVEGERGGVTGDSGVVYGWVGISDLAVNVAGEVGFVDVEPD